MEGFYLLFLIPGSIFLTMGLIFLFLMRKVTKPAKDWKLTTGVIIQKDQIWRGRCSSALVARLGKSKIVLIADDSDISAQRLKKLLYAVRRPVVDHDHLKGHSLSDLRQRGQALLSQGCIVPDRNNDGAVIREF